MRAASVFRCFLIFAPALLLGCQASSDGTAEGTAVSAASPETEAIEAYPDTLAAAYLGHAHGQELYVPVYSHIYAWDNRRPVNLAVTLSIRNTDPRHALRLSKVWYYDSEGTLVRRFLEAPPLIVAPMASTDFFINETDTSGGAGANFVVTWSADSLVTEPIVEAVMISTRSTQGISFTSAARILRQW